MVEKIEIRGITVKNRIFALLLVFILITSIVACDVTITVDPPSDSDKSVPTIADFSISTGTSEPEDKSEPSQSVEDSSVDDATSDEGESSVEDPSDVSDESSNVITTADYPYQNPESIGNYKIEKDELDKYFEDSVFIGNSIMVHFSNYVSAKRSKDPAFLGKAKILAASAYSFQLEFNKNLDTKYMIKFQGEADHVWNIVEKSGAKNVYISLMALNELGLHPTESCAEGTFNNTVKVIENIKEKCPDVNIVVLSNTYMVTGFNYQRLNNTNIYKLNSLALEYCNENGIDFIDISSGLNENGYLKTDYCLDPQKGGQGCHLKQSCYDYWVSTLRNYAFAKQNGVYQNPTELPRP